MSQLYELFYIVSASLSQQEVPAIQQAVREVISAHQGALDGEDRLVRRRLAHPIKQMTHGYYLLTYFSADTKALPEINEILRHNQNILRYQLIAVSRQGMLPTEKTLSERKSEQVTVVEKPIAKAPVITTAKEPASDAPATAETKISLEDLDKKLEKILTSDEL